MLIDMEVINKERMNIMTIILNKTQTKRMLKVKEALEDMFEGNLMKYGVTPCMIYEILDIYNNILNTQNHVGSTISTNIKHFFEKRGFEIKQASPIAWYIGI